VAVSDGKPAFSNCAIVGNDAPTGGGGFVDSNAAASAASFKACDFEENFASLNGGGLYVASAGDTSVPTLSGCLFYYNYADLNGGGVYSSGKTTLSGCVFQNNQAGGNGGAVTAAFSVNLLANCILLSNACATNGAAVYVTGSATVGHITNCSTFANVQGNNSFYSDISSSVTVNNSILFDNSSELASGGSTAVSVSYSDVYGGWSGSGSHNINADPLYTDPANGNLFPLPASPCNNTANPVAPGYNGKDILGVVRSNPPDMGAYEF